MANRYWVGGSATWDGTAGSKWATTSGGAGGASVPGASDDVFIDANSGSGTIALGTNPVINSLNFTGFTGTFTHGSFILTIGSATAGAGNIFLKLSSGMTYSGASGQIRTNSTSATPQILDTAGKTLGSLQFQKAASTYVLASDVTCDVFSVTAGAVDTANYNINTRLFSTSGTTTRSLTLGSSVITASGNMSFSSSTGLTVTAGTSIIRLQGGTSHTFGASTWYQIEIDDIATTISRGSAGAIACTNLIINSSVDRTVLYNSDITISGTFTINGGGHDARVLLKPSSTTSYTITSAANSISHALFQSIIAAGAASWDFSANNTVGDLGGNTSITFKSSVTYYYIGDGADGNLAASWSTSSGGSAGSVIPLPQDMMVFDSASFSSDSNYNHNITHSGGVNFSAVDQVITLDTNTCYFYGDITLKSNLIVSGSGSWYISGFGSLDFDTRGVSIARDLTIGQTIAGLTLTMQDDLIITGTLLFKKCTFNANDYDITAGIITGEINMTCTLNMGSGTWKPTSTAATIIWDTSLSGVGVNRDTSTILIDVVTANAQTIKFSTKNYYNLHILTTGRTGSLTIDGGPYIYNSLRIFDTTTEYDLILSYGSSLRLNSSITLVEIKGSPTHYLDIIASSGAGSYFTSGTYSGDIILRWVKLSNLDAAGSSDWYAADSLDLGGNTDWNFSDPSVSLATVDTDAVSSILSTTAVGNGEVTDDGGATVTERGVVVDTSTSPTTADAKFAAGAGGVGVFTANITGLTPETHYYVRSYAINSAGTSYGDEVEFDSDETPSAPTVTTGAVTNIGSTIALGHGDITDMGTEPVTERGLVASTTTNPDYSDLLFSQSSSSLGAYTKQLRTLEPDTHYYVKAYAINSVGIAYGNEVEFTTNESPAIPDSNFRPRLSQEITPPRVVHFKIDKLDTNDVFLEELTPKLLDGEVRVTYDDIHRRTCKFSLLETLPEDWMSARWKLYYGTDVVKDYEYQTGDTFAILEERYGWPAGTIAQINYNITEAAVEVGDVIYIPLYRNTTDIQIPESGRVKYESLGIFLPLNPKESQTDGGYVTEYQGVDKTELLVNEYNDIPITYAAGTTLKEVAIDIFDRIAETKLNLADVPYALESEFTFEEGTSLEHILSILIRSFPADWYYDRNGIAVLESLPSVTLRPIVYNFIEGEDSIHIDVDRSFESEKFWNKVVVVGGRVDTGIFRQTYTNADGVTLAGRTISRFFKEDAATSQDQVNDLANQFLEAGSRIPSTIRIANLPLVKLEPKQIVRYNNTRYEILDFNIPLDLELQTIQAGEVF